MNDTCSTIKCSTCKLLTIEDNIAEVKLMHAAMRLNGLNGLVRSDTATSAEQAMKMMEIAHQEEHPYDLITMDLDMPRISGKELLSQLRADARFADTPIIVISGVYDKDSIEECYALGADMFIRKSLELHSLLDLYKALRNTLTEDGCISSSGIEQRYTALRSKMIS